MQHPAPALNPQQQKKKKTPWQRLKIRLLCLVAYGVYRLLTSTYRIKFINPELREKAKAMHPKGSFVYGLWHEFFFSGVAAHANQEIAPMISQSNDGELITYIGIKLGFKPVRGSTSRGGEDARLELYRRINVGLMAAFTADGPKGPRRKMKSGLVDLSRTGKMPILPLATAADRKWVLHKTWDRTFIPKPFARVYIAYGEPFIIAEDSHGAKFAEAKRLAQEALNEAARKAESACRE